MNRKDLEFLLAYAQCYKLMPNTVDEVLDTIAADESIDECLQYNDCSIDDYIEDFINQYNQVMALGMIAEVSHCMVNGMTIWQATNEWNCAYFADNLK